MHDIRFFILHIYWFCGPSSHNWPLPHPQQKILVEPLKPPALSPKQNTMESFMHPYNIELDVKSASIDTLIENAFM